MKKEKKHQFNLFIIILIGVVVLLTFEYYIQMRYKALVTTPSMIEDFRTKEGVDLISLKKKYNIDYAKIHNEKITETSAISLPRIDLLSISLEQNPIVLRSSLENSLLSVRPYVFSRFFSLYILFPLIYPNRPDGFLIIQKITP